VSLAEAEAALARRREDSHPQDSEDAMDQIAPDGSSGAEIEVDPDGYLVSDGGSIDSLIQSILGSGPSPVVEAEALATTEAGGAKGGRQ
jgi:hypothetical protein